MMESNSDVEGRKLAIQIIATLVNMKRVMAEMILKPAGISPDLYGSLLYMRDETGHALSKRDVAPLILKAVDERGDGRLVVRNLIEIASSWSSFHLAQHEYEARATVQKAREIMGTIELMEARESKQRELARKEELARMEQERAKMFSQQSDLLLMMFDELARSSDHQRRGYLLQDLVNRTFDLNEIAVVQPFTRNDGGEQIDGAFKLDGWHYLVEIRWRAKLADTRDLDGLRGQVGRSGKQTMGLFLSVEGWSEHVPELLKQNPSKDVVLMNGYDLRTALSGAADLRDFILAKIARLNLYADPAFSVQQYLAEQ
jgi:hypothetical protein